MPSKEIKIALKEIRDAIKNKEFPKAISKCQEVLKEEPGNYMALVFIGAAYQDKDKNEAAKYLHQAVSCSDEPTIALQGLANCAEINELPDIFGKLLKLVPERFSEYHSKLVSISTNEKCLSDCVTILQTEIELENLEKYENRIQSAKHSLGRVLLKQNEINENWNQLFKISLETLLDDNQYDNKLEAYKRYLKLLYKLKDFEGLIIHSCNMIEQYPTSVYPLEWICKMYSEHFNSETFSIENYLKNSIDIYTDQLLKLNQSSELGMLVKAIRLYNENQFIQARDYLLHIKKSQPSLQLCLEYLAKIYFTLEAYELAEIHYRKLDLKCFEFAECLSYSLDSNKLNEAISLFNELLPNLLDNAKFKALCCLTRIYFALKQSDEGLKILEKLKQEGEHSIIALFEAEYIMTPSEGISKLETIHTESFLVDFLRGKLYFHIEDYEKSLIHLLKATRQKPYSSECFLWLGKVYSTSNDLARAKKCFEKCISLNSLNDLAIKNLCAIYRKTEEWDLNHALLQSASKNLLGDKMRWAYFQLGIHNLNLKHFDESISSFRTAIRYDLNDVLSWEGLADAYYQRGSFNSAMKVYQKILEIDPDNIYAKLQVATTKLTLHMYSEAIEAFDELLEENLDYMPALKGAAEAHYGLANHFLVQRLLGRCKDNLQKAVNHLQRVFSIGKRDMIWLWRLMATVFSMVACMPNSKAFLEVSGKLAGQEEDIVVLKRHDLFEFAERFYTCALKLHQNNALLWHELSLCYYYHAQKYENEESKLKHIKLARDSCKQSIKLQGNRWQNWNLFGIICATKEINNLPLAQHCFIEAIQLDRKSAISWTNLGVLYLSQHNIKLANKAFGRAQQCDTSFINAWIGQAIIAETIAENDEAMDLFRHCTQLEFHVESALGYAFWVCSILSKPDHLKDRHYKYAIENMNAITVASDSINWYYGAEHDNSSVEALSYLGYLNSKQSLWKGAINAFELAVKKTENLDKDKMFCNLGYSYLKNNQPMEAIEAFNLVSEATYKSTVGLALAHFRAGQYPESYSAYDSALEWLANTDAEKALTLVAMSSMVYEAQGENDTKTILLQCISLENSPIQALYSACALGILHRDSQLTEVILDEFKRYENDIEHCHHIAYLTSEIFKSNNEKRNGLLYLQSRVHAFPDRPLLRDVLANYLLRNSGKTKKYLIAASKIAQSTIDLGLRSSKRSTSMQAAKSLAIASDSMKYVDQIKRFKLAQRAVHINPICKEAWGALIACQS